MDPWPKQLERLEALFAASGKTMREISIAAGMGESYFRDVLRRARKPKIETLEGLALALGSSVAFIVSGQDDDGDKQQPTSLKKTRQVRVIGQAQPGAWKEFDELLAYETVPAVETDLEGEQFAVQVVGNSMDALGIHDGYYVICVPYTGNARTGDILIVERRRGPTFERTVKQLVIKADAYELWPRSHDPRHQTPIIIKPSDWTEDDGTTVEIRGIAIQGSFSLLRR